MIHHLHCNVPLDETWRLWINKQLHMQAGNWRNSIRRRYRTRQGACFHREAEADDSAIIGTGQIGPCCGILAWSDENRHWVKSRLGSQRECSAWSNADWFRCHAQTRCLEQVLEIDRITKCDEVYRVTNSDKDIHLKPSAITLCDIRQWPDFLGR